MTQRCTVSDFSNYLIKCDDLQPTEQAIRRTLWQLIEKSCSYGQVFQIASKINLFQNLDGNAICKIFSSILDEKRILTVCPPKSPIQVSTPSPSNKRSQITFDNTGTNLVDESLGNKRRRQESSESKKLLYSDIFVKSVLCLYSHYFKKLRDERYDSKVILKLLNIPADQPWEKIKIDYQLIQDTLQNLVLQVDGHHLTSKAEDTSNLSDSSTSCSEFQALLENVAEAFKPVERLHEGVTDLLNRLNSNMQRDSIHKVLNLDEEASIDTIRDAHSKMVELIEKAYWLKEEQREWAIHRLDARLQSEEEELKSRIVKEEKRMEQITQRRAAINYVLNKACFKKTAPSLQNCLEILGWNKEIDPIQFAKKAGRKVMAILHPDSLPHESDEKYLKLQVEAFKKVNDAHQFIMKHFDQLKHMNNLNNVSANPYFNLKRDAANIQLPYVRNSNKAPFLKKIGF